MAAIAAAAVMMMSDVALAGPRCGSDGGTRTQTFACDTGELISQVFVEAGMHAARITFNCTNANGAAGKSSGVLGGNRPGAGYNSGTAACQPGQAVWSIASQCGWYVDKVVQIACGTMQSGTLAHSMATQRVDAGTATGTPTSLACPKDQGIYKVVVKSGNWLNSIEVFCREP